MKKIIYSLSLLFLLFISCQQNSENNSISIDSVNFSEKNISLKCGEQKAVELFYNPKNADIFEEEFKFTCIPEDFCKIIKSDSSGCIIEGVKKGSGVLKAYYNGIADYVQVDVQGVEITSVPYISLPYVDLTMEIGQKKVVTANIVGGMREDSEKFTWESTKPDIVKIDYTGNTAVLNARKFC